MKIKNIKEEVNDKHMKKAYFLFMAVVLTLLMQACLHDNKTAFDLPAAQRIDQSVAEYTALLESSEGGWMLQYYAGKNYSYGGYTLLLKFKDGQVTAMGDVLDPEVKATSDYEVVKDQGPMLSFNVYNKVIHPLAEAWLGNPDGIQGDYEFSILRATTDSIVLRGRKWKNEMVLTRLPKDANWEEMMLGIITVKDGMSVSTYNFIQGNDTLAQGTIDPTTRRLSVTLGKTTWDMPYCTHATGIVLRQPIVIGNKQYQNFTWNETDKVLTDNDLKLAQFVPKNHKTLDFWVGEWQLKTSLRKRITLTLELGTAANTLKGHLLYDKVSYELQLTYDPATGRIELPGQPVIDPTYKYPAGIVLIPASLKEKKIFGEGKGSMYFTWNGDMERADAEDSGQITGHTVDSFLGVAYGEDLSPILDPKGGYVYAFTLPNIEYMRKIK